MMPTLLMRAPRATDFLRKPSGKPQRRGITHANSKLCVHCGQPTNAHHGSQGCKSRWCPNLPFGTGWANTKYTPKEAN